jgi:tetratricopeptide (TPR) repeat protein
MLRQFVLASVLIGFLIFNETLLFAQESESVTPVSEIWTIAHDILRLEAESLGHTPVYAILDAVLSAAQQTIPVTPPFSQEDAVTILRHIATLLHARQFRIGDAMLLTQTCAVPQNSSEIQHIGDCDSFSFLYLAIGEVLDLPLRIVSLPEHTFIRWQFEDGTYLNWETTANTVWTDEAYVDWYNSTHAGALSKNDLRPVEREDIFFLVHYNLGNAFTQQRRYDAALRHYSASLDINPDYANAYYQRGQVWHVMGNYDRAITDFTQMLQQNPDDVNALLNRGSAYNLNDNYSQAIADFNQVLLRQPEHVDAFFNRGTALLYAGESEQALADFSCVLELNPNDADAFAYRGIVWSNTGDYNRALADFTAANALDPWSADIANSLAWFLATCPDAAYRNGEQAIQHAQRALALQPALRMVYLDTLAAAYAEAGQFHEAVAIQENAIRLLEATGNLVELPGYQKRLELYILEQPYRESPD